MELRRKLYVRGSSVETTIPKPLLFALDQNKKHDVIFSFDKETKKWTINFEERPQKAKRRKIKLKSNVVLKGDE